MSPGRTMPDEVEVITELDLGEPPQEVLDYAENELGEDPETRCQVLEEFRDLIYERGECTPHRTDDAFLLRFLRGRYFVVNRAHRLLANYYDFKETNPCYVENVDLMILRKVIDNELITVWPFRDQTGRRALVYRFGSWDPNAFSVTELFRSTLLLLELAILEQRAQILGGICVFDLGGLTMQHVLQMTPTVAKHMFQMMVTCFPMKVFSFHIVNQPWYFEIGYSFIKPFLTEDMRKRVFVHGDNMESFQEHLGAKHLPERYGGTQSDRNAGPDWLDHFTNTPAIIKELESLNYTINKIDENENKQK